MATRPDRRDRRRRRRGRGQRRIHRRPRGRGAGSVGDAAGEGRAGHGRGNGFCTAGATRIAHDGLEDLKDFIEPEDRHERAVVPPYSAEEGAADLAKVTEGRNDPELTEVLVTESQETLRWLNGLGLKYRLMYERQAHARAEGDPGRVRGPDRRGLRVRPRLAPRTPGGGVGERQGARHPVQHRGHDRRRPGDRGGAGRGLVHLPLTPCSGTPSPPPTSPTGS